MLVHQSKRLHSPCCLITNHDAALFPDLFVKRVSWLASHVSSKEHANRERQCLKFSQNSLLNGLTHEQVHLGTGSVNTVISDLRPTTLWPMTCILDPTCLVMGGGVCKTWVTPWPTLWPTIWLTLKCIMSHVKFINYLWASKPIQAQFQVTCTQL